MIENAGKTCNLCKISVINELTGKCGHVICSQCLYKLILFNFKMIGENKNVNEVITLKCIICFNGEFDTTIKDMYSIQDEDFTNEICQDHNLINKLYCKNCKVRVCVSCMHLHHSNHDYCTMAEITSYCDEHNKKYSHHCISCVKTICRRCKKISHIGHKIKSVEDYYEDIDDELRRVVMPKIKSFIQSLNDEEVNYMMNLNKMYQNLSNEISNLISYLQDYEKSIKDLIDKQWQVSFDFAKNNLERYALELETVNCEQYNNLNHLDIISKSIQGLNSTMKQVKVSDNYSYKIDELKKELANIKDGLKSNKIEVDIDYKSLMKKKTNYTCVTTLHGHTDWIYSLLELKNGWIVSGSYDNSIRVWDNNTCVKVLNAGSGIYCLIQLVDGRLLAGMSNGEIKVWDIPSDNKSENIRHIKTIKAHSDWIRCIRQLYEGLVASSSYDKTIKIWNIDLYFNRMKTLEGHTGYIYTILQLRNGLIISGSDDKTIKVWNPGQNYACIHSLIAHDHAICSLIQLKSGFIVSTSWDKTMKIWNYTEDGMTFIKSIDGFAAGVYSICQLKEGFIAAGSLNDVIKISDPSQDYKCVNILLGHKHQVYSIIELNDGRIASAGYDKNIKIWE